MAPEFTGQAGVAHTDIDGMYVSKFNNYTTSKGVDKFGVLKFGGFAFDHYMRVKLHDETIEWLLNNYGDQGQEIVTNLHDVPVSLHDFDQLQLLDTVLGNGDTLPTSNPLINFLNFLLLQILEEGLGTEGSSFENSGLSFGSFMDDADSAISSEQLFSYVGAPNESLFKDFKYCVRLNYVNTANDDIEDFFQNFYSGNKNKESKQNIGREKAFIYKESVTEEEEEGQGLADNPRVLVFPIVEKQYSGSFRLTKTTNPLSRSRQSVGNLARRI